jgi:hypothetical protein
MPKRQISSVVTISFNGAQRNDETAFAFDHRCRHHVCMSGKIRALLPFGRSALWCAKSRQAFKMRISAQKAQHSLLLNA